MACMRKVTTTHVPFKCTGEKELHAPGHILQIKSFGYDFSGEPPGAMFSFCEPAGWRTRLEAKVVCSDNPAVAPIRYQVSYAASSDQGRMEKLLPNGQSLNLAGYAPDEEGSINLIERDLGTKFRGPGLDCVSGVGASSAMHTKLRPTEYPAKKTKTDTVQTIDSMTPVHIQSFTRVATPVRVTTDVTNVDRTTCVQPVEPSLNLWPCVPPPARAPVLKMRSAAPGSSSNAIAETVTSHKSRSAVNRTANAGPDATLVSTNAGLNYLHNNNCF